MNLLKALFSVGSMTFVSRILGFVRDLLIARIFGAGMQTDAFFVAFKLPNMLRRISAEGAFSQAFVPILAEYKNQRTPEATHRLINHVASLMGVILIFVSILGMLAAPWVVTVSAPGFIEDQTKFQLTVELLRITFPYILFISLVSLAGGVLNTFGNFTVPAFTPVWLNVSFITAAVLVAPYFDHSVHVLAWAVFAGGILQFLYQLPALAKLGLVPKLSFDLQDEGVWRILRLMGPAIFGVSIAQISLLINTIFASLLQTGSVSWLYYADRLMEFPTGILGVALGTILLPSLSKAVADRHDQEFSQLLDWGLRLTFMMALPAAVALAVLATPLISSLFFYGQFNEIDVMMTRQALIAYSLGLIGLILVKVLAPGFYARQNVKTPVKIAIFTLILTQVMNVVFVFVLDLKHAGLALSIGLGACLNALLLFINLRRTDLYQPEPGWLAFILKVMLAVGAMAWVIHAVAGPNESWLTFGLWEKMGRLCVLLVSGVGAYFLILFLLGIRPASFMRRVTV